MFIKKEQYGEFDKLRLVFMSGFDAPIPNQDATEATQKAPEKTETADKKEAAKDLAPKIKEHQKNALQWIKTIEGKVPPHQKAAAGKLARALEAHTNASFDTILNQYKLQRDPEKGGMGSSFDTSKEADALRTQANELYGRIYARVKNSEKYVEHQMFQDVLDTAMGSGMQEAIVDAHLQKYPNLSPEVRSALARLIVEGKMVQLKQADLDESKYKNDVEAFFTDVDHYQENIGNQLEQEGKVQAIVNRFLLETPNPEAYQVEKDYINNIILNTTDKNNAKYLLEKYGNPSNPKSPAGKAVDVLAKRYDIRFYKGKNDKPAYAFDLKAKIALTPEEIEESIIKELNGQPLNQEEGIQAYSKDIDTHAKWFRDRREEVKEDITTDWDDWPGHTAVMDLAPMTERFRDGIQRIEDAKKPNKKTEAQKKEEAEAQKKESEAAEKNERMAAYKKMAAKLNPAIKVAIKAGYIGKEPKATEEAKNEQPDFSKADYQDVVVLKNAEAGNTITIALNAQGATVMIEHSSTKKESKNGNQRAYSITRSFSTPEEFGNESLVQMAEAAKNNINQNLKKVKEINAQLNNLPKGMAVDFKKAPTFSELAHSNYKIPNAPIKMDGIQVGEISFDTSGGTKKATVRLGTEKKEVNLNQLNKHLTDNVGNAKKAAEAAQKVKSEIEAQKTEANTKITTPEGMTYQSVNNLDNIDFTDPTIDASVPLGNIMQGEKKVATLSVKLNKKKGQKTRPYILTVNDINHEFNTMAELNTFLESEKFKNDTADQAKAQKAMEEIKAKVDPEGRKAPEEMGLGELIGSLGQLYKMFQEAMKSGDWQTLQDGLKDFNEGRNPTERMQEAQEKYKTEIDKVHNVSDLLSMYNRPYKSELAQKLFDTDQAKTPYRIQLKMVIQEKLSNELGLAISNMEAKSANDTYIEAMHGPDKLRIYLKREGKKTTVRTEEIKPNDNGVEYVAHQSEGIKVDNLKDGNKNLKSAIENSINEFKTPASADETPEAPAAAAPAPAPAAAAASPPPKKK